MRTRLPGWRPLADDTVVVRQRGEVVEVCGTPFGGREGNARSGDWVPLEAIVFLSKGAEQLRLEVVDLEDAFSEILQRTMWFVEDGKLRERLLDLIVHLAKSLPRFRLYSSLAHALHPCFDSGPLEGQPC